MSALCIFSELFLVCRLNTIIRPNCPLQATQQGAPYKHGHVL